MILRLLWLSFRGGIVGLALSEFIYSNGGSLDFGFITEEHGLSSGPVRLERGSEDTFGLAHVEEAKRLKSIQKIGFVDALTFIEFIAAHFDQALDNPQRSTSQPRYCLVRHEGERRLVLIVELKAEAGKTFYSIITAFPISDRKKYLKDNKILWTKRSAC